MKYPVYRYMVIDGVCRQDAPGGRWTQLTLEETDELLSRLDGQTIDPPAPAATHVTETIFHHRV